MQLIDATTHYSIALNISGRGVFSIAFDGQPSPLIGSIISLMFLTGHCFQKMKAII